MRHWDDYYRGVQPLAFASERFREAFGGRFRAFSSNFCALVVDGTRERMELTSFTGLPPRSQRRAMNIWTENRMAAQSQIAHTEALVKSVAYVMVAVGQLDEGPTLTVEDGLDAITLPDAHHPHIQRAGLKRYRDDAGHVIYHLYLPDAMWVLRSQAPTTGAGMSAMVPMPGVPWPAPNPLGEVPLVPLINRPRLGSEGQSEIDSIMSNQDAVNKYRADALVAAEFAAFRQRWVIGIDIPVDPKTGKEVEPFKAAVDRLWTVPRADPEDPNPGQVQFGEFEATDLEPYQRMIESEVGAISSISRLPYHYLLGQPQSIPPSGESLKSSEAGLVAKVRTQMVHFGDAWEEVVRLSLLAVGDPAGRSRMAEAQWRDPETRNESARADATVKLFDAGIITREEARAATGYAPVIEQEA